MKGMILNDYERCEGDDSKLLFVLSVLVCGCCMMLVSVRCPRSLS